MKYIRKTSYIFIFLIICLQSGFSQQQLEAEELLIKSWETDQILKTPESAIYDSANDVIYVSNINGKATEKDSNGFISKLSPEGEIIQLRWVEGLNAPKGMGIIGNKLFVTDIDEIAEINIKANEVARRYPVEKAKFLNDIAIDDNGIIYVSDMQTDKIHKLDDGIVSTWLEGKEIKRPNGLLIRKGELFIGCKELISVDIVDKSNKILTGGLESGIDGIAMDQDGNIYFSFWKGKVFKLNPGHEAQMILNTVDKNLQSADIYIAREKNLLLVPTFFGNKLIAYEVSH